MPPHAVGRVGVGRGLLGTTGLLLKSKPPGPLVASLGRHSARGGGGGRGANQPSAGAGGPGEAGRDRGGGTDGHKAALGS